MKNIKQFECAECGSTFELNSNNVNKRYASTVAGNESLLVTYVVCPSCHKISYVQLDNAHTMQAMKELSRLLKKQVVAEKQGHGLKRKDKARVLQLNKEIDMARKYLLRQYNGVEMVYANYVETCVENRHFVFALRSVQGEKEEATKDNV